MVMVCIYRRNHSKSASKPASKPVQAVNNDNDDYGLRENVLYIPADSTPIQTNRNWQNTNRISVDIDGNYSTVDLDEIVPVEDSTTGDYSAIDLVKISPTESIKNESTNEKPIIAPKPKQKMTIEDDVSVPDKKKVKHGAASDKNWREYTVVNYPNKSNFDKSEDQPSTSNVYAVVAKKKRMSGGKRKNQKRDSLTANEDGERDRLS